MTTLGPEADPPRAPDESFAALSRLIAKAPQFSAGDSWTFVRTSNLEGRTAQDEYTLTLRTVTDRELVAVSGIRLTPSLAALSTIGQKNALFNFHPHAMSLQWPLVAGDAWNESYERREADGAQRVLGRYEGKAQVGRAESITVPAGTFDTLLVTHTLKISQTNGPAETMHRTVWYSRSVRYFVRVVIERRQLNGTLLETATHELKNYSLAR